MDWSALNLPANARATSADEFHMACPVQGGRDAFWVQPERERLGCRKCSRDGDGGLGADVAILEPHARHLGIWTEPKGGRSGRAIRQAPRRPTPAPSGAALEPAASDRPARVWTAAGTVAGTPGAAYLARPDRLGEPWPGEHPAVRWLPAASDEGCELAPRLPTGAAGCLAYLFAAPGDRGAVHAIQMEAIDGAGDRLRGWWYRDRDRGAWEERPAGRVSVAGSRFGKGRRVFEGRAGPGACWLVEGPIDALVMARALRAGAGAVLGAAGTSFFQLGAVEGVAPRAEVVIAADGDPAGRAAAIRLAEALEYAGRRPWSIQSPGAGLDWCDVFAAARVERDEREAMRDE